MEPINHGFLVNHSQKWERVPLHSGESGKNILRCKMIIGFGGEDTPRRVTISCSCSLPTKDGDFYRPIGRTSVLSIAIVLQNIKKKKGKKMMMTR